jgi:hypothetical protein
MTKPKTIVQCYFPIKDFQGFGCYLASTLNLHHYCKKNNYILKNTYQFHKGIQDLLHSDLINNEAISVQDIPIIFTNNDLITYISNNMEKSVYYISYYIGFTDILIYRNEYIDSINFVKNTCLQFSDDLIYNIQQTLVNANCMEKEYISVHLRIGDEELVSKMGVYEPLYDCFITNFNNIILPLLESNKIIIISDSITFKKLLKQKFTHKNIYIVSTIPSHTGIDSHVTKESMLGTLHDFGIMAFSKKIYMISAQHQHPLVSSFFSRYCSCIYDIPIVIKKIQLEIFSNKSLYQVIK